LAKVEIIPENCIACGFCALFAPEVFDYDDEGLVVLKDKEGNVLNLETLSPEIIKAYQKCPSAAILLNKND